MDSVVHFEIPAKNLRRVQSFYRESFGWKTQANSKLAYVMVQTTPTDSKGMPKKKGAINGGMLHANAFIKSPIITINVKSIDETVKKILLFGGKVAHAKMPVGSMGFAAYVKDSEGNVIGLWQNS